MSSPLFCAPEPFLEAGYDCIVMDFMMRGCGCTHCIEADKVYRLVASANFDAEVNGLCGPIAIR